MVEAITPRNGCITLRWWSLLYALLLLLSMSFPTSPTWRLTGQPLPAAAAPMTGRAELGGPHGLVITTVTPDGDICTRSRRVLIEVGDGGGYGPVDLAPPCCSNILMRMPTLLQSIETRGSDSQVSLFTRCSSHLWRTEILFTEDGLLLGDELHDRVLGVYGYWFWLPSLFLIMARFDGRFWKNLAPRRQHLLIAGLLMLMASRLVLRWFN